MIIRSKDKVQVIGKNKSVWVLDTNALTVTHNAVDVEPTVTAFHSEHIKYHLHYSAEYRKNRLRKLVNNGEILGYLTELDKAVENAMERQVEKWKADDKEYQQSLAVGDLCKAQDLYTNKYFQNFSIFAHSHQPKTVFLSLHMTPEL